MYTRNLYRHGILRFGTGKHDIFVTGSNAGMLENIVFLELKRQGYEVYIGKLANKKIDFIATKGNYPKYVVSMDTIWGDDYEGIKRLNLLDFLLTPP